MLFIYTNDVTILIFVKVNLLKSKYNNKLGLQIVNADVNANS
jgi:hypothetical protein